MNSLRVAVLAFAVAAGPWTASAETGFLDRAVTLDNVIYRYQVYVPLEWVATRTWPIVLFLHGNNAQGSDGSSHLARGSAADLASAIRADRTRLPALVVFAQAAPDTTWAFRRMQDMVAQQVEATVSEFSGDRDRIYLWGHSMGGAGVLRIAARWPDRFAAIVASAGYTVAGPQVPAGRVAEDRKSNVFLGSPSPYAALANLLKGLPIWIFHSDVDQIVSVDESRRLVTELRMLGTDIRYTEYRGLSHAETGAKVAMETEVTSWLLGQRRIAPK